MNHQVTISTQYKAIKITLSLDNKLLFDAIIEKDKIKVNYLDINHEDSFLNLFLNTSIKDGVIKIPNFITIFQTDDNIIINQDGTFPQMYPCELILDLPFVYINKLSISSISSINKNGMFVVSEHLISNTIKTYSKFVINYGGAVQSDNIEAESMFINSGKLKVVNLNVTKSSHTNYETGIIDVQNAVLNECSFENKGELITRNYTQTKSSFHNKQDFSFINKGTWLATGTVELSEVLVHNFGIINWTDVKFGLDIHYGHGYRNEKVWVFDNVEADNDLFITNCGVLHLKNSELAFNHLLNYKNLIISSGKYYVRQLQNNGLISFIENHFTFTDNKKSIVPHYLVSDGFVGPGKFEAEQNFNYFHPKLPEFIVCQKDLYFAHLHQQKGLKALKNVSCSGTVYYYCKNVNLKKNKTFKNIAHLSLNVQGDFNNSEYTLITNRLTLNVHGKILKNGSSNEKMGSIISYGDLSISCHNLDNQFGKIYGKKYTNVRAMESMKNGSPISGGSFRYTFNGSYIASNAILDISAKEFINTYGQVYSHTRLNITAKNKLGNIAGDISCGADICITTKELLNTRDAVYRQGVGNWTWAYTQCSHDFESSDQAYIRSLRSIYFRVEQGTNLASSILAQKNIEYNYKSEQPSTFTSVARHNWGWGLNDKVGTQRSGSPVSVYPSTIQAGQSIQLNTGSFTISSNMKSPVIEITANNGNFNNPVRHRKHIDKQNTIFVDLTQLIQNEVKNKKGFLSLTDGYVKSDIGKKVVMKQSSVMLMNDDNQHLYNISFNTNIMNPLKYLPSDFLNLFIQSTLSSVCGKVYIKNQNKQSLSKTLLSNANLFQQETHKTIVSKSDLSGAPAMLLQELKQVNDVIQSQTVLCIPSNEICEFQSEGDVVANSFNCTTKNDQKHSNNRIVARDILNVISREGSVIRETEKYTVLHDEDKHKVFEDVAMPKQTFICLKGDINITAKQDSMSFGTDTVAVNGDINETASYITSKPLILQRTEETKESKGTLFTSETVTTDTTHTIVSTKNIAKNHIVKTAEIITQNGTQDVAGVKIVYDGDTTIESSIVVNTKTVNTESSNGFTTTNTYESNDSTTISQSNINVPTVVFKGDAAKLKGVIVSGNVIIDETDTGLYVGPQVQELKYTKQITVDAPLSSLDAGCRGGFEVMVQSRLAVDKIIRLIDDKEIVLESVIWNKQRTEIVGKIIETTYELKKWHTNWHIQTQTIPDEALIIVAVAVSFATYGTGATLMGTSGTIGAMSSAGFTTLCTAATTSFLKTGDPIATAKSLLSEDFARNLAISIASAGICDKLGLVKPGINGSIIDFAKYNAMKAIVNIPLNTVIGKQNINEVLKSELVNCVVDTVQQFTAVQIGKMYRKGDLSFINHKSIHFVSGATTGAINSLILNKPIIEGALSAATGAVIGELAAELNPLNIESIDTQLVTSKIIAGTVALLLKQDVGLAIKTATNTLENNWFHCVMAAITALGFTHAVKEALDTYQEDGLEAAIDVLILHGIVMRLEKGIMYFGGKIFSKSKDLWKAVKLDDAKNMWVKVIGKKNLLDPKSVINKDLLHHKLSIQERMGEVGTPFAGGNTGNIFKNENRIVNQYGGSLGDWVKKSSSKFTTKAGQDIELHWVENIKTGKRVEYKQKLLG